jgi:hypothetical protein
MIEKCKYPECGYRAEKTWALVPLCHAHFETIREETLRFYRLYSCVNYSDRRHYLKIAHLIPWSRVSKGEVLPDGSVCRD